MAAAARTLPWIGTGDSQHERRFQDEQRNRLQRIQDFQLRGQEELIGTDDPRHSLQENGRLANQWYLDDGDILCHPLLVLPHPQAVRCSQR